MAEIDYTEAQFTTSGGAVNAEQLSQEFPVPPATFASTGAVITGLPVFASGADPRVTLITDIALDGTDTATALAIVNAHTALGPSDGGTTGELGPFGGYGRRQNYLRDSEDLDAATSSWTNNNSTVTANNAVAPNGEMTADLVTWNSVGIGLRQSSLGTTIGDVYGISFWARHISGNNNLRIDIRDGTGSGDIPIATTFVRYHVDVMAGAGGDFIDFTVAGTVGAFEIWGIQMVDRTANHLHPYMRTENEQFLTDEFGSVTSGDHLVTGKIKNPAYNTVLDGLSIGGLHIENNSGTPDEIVDIDPGQCIDSTGVESIVVASTVTADNTASGAGGLDTGSVAADTKYAVFVIDDTTGDNAADALLSLSSTAPTLPSGYDVFRRVGWMLTDATSDFVTFVQPKSESRSRWVYFQREIQLQAAGTASAFTLTATLAASDFTPDTATRQSFDLVSEKIGAASLTSRVELVPTGWDQTAGAAFWAARSGFSGANDITGGNTFEMPVLGGLSADVLYRVQPAGDAEADVFLRGYEDTL